MSNLPKTLMKTIVLFFIIILPIVFLSDKEVQVCNNMVLVEKPFQDLNGTLYDVELSFFDSKGDLLEVKKIIKIEPGKKSEKLHSPRRADFIRMEWTMAPIEKQNEYLLEIPTYNLCGKVYLDRFGVTRIKIENDTQVDRY